MYVKASSEFVALLDLLHVKASFGAYKDISEFKGDSFLDIHVRVHVLILFYYSLTLLLVYVSFFIKVLVRGSPRPEDQFPIEITAKDESVLLITAPSVW